MTHLPGQMDGAARALGGILEILLTIVGALFATYFLGAVLHELSHALAGLLMGFSVDEVRFGSGPVLLRAGLGRTAIQLRLVPGEGLVQHVRSAGRFKRLRMFVFIAAGPACDIGLLVWLVSAMLKPDPGDYWRIALGASVCVQAYRVLGNLGPRMVEIDGETMANDGLQLLQVLADTHAGTIPHVSHEPIEQRLYEGMIKRYLRPGEPVPPPAGRSRAILDFYEARYINKESLRSEMLTPLDAALSTPRPASEELLILETLITAALRAAEPHVLPDLDRWSARAYALAPDITTLKGSRGAAMIETGHPAEGLALLEDGLNGEKHNDCLVHAFRALGHFRLGGAAAAQGEFAEATANFDHENWQGNDIRRILERIARTIGLEFKSPATWSAEAARAAFRNQTAGQPAQPDRP